MELTQVLVNSSSPLRVLLLGVFAEEIPQIYC